MRKARVLLIFVLIMLVATIFVACGEKPGQTDNWEHQHEFVESQAGQYLKTAATCEKPAVYYKHCSICGTLGEEYTFGTALGHSGGQATCLKPAVCQVCSKEYGEALGHDYDDGVVTTEATCTENGVLTKTCKRCGDAQTSPIPASHKGDWYITAEPRCFDKGERQRICTVCDVIETEELPAIGHHDLKEATCEEGRKCSKCHYVEGTGTGHVFSEWASVTGEEATCTQAGRETRCCLVCGKTQERTTSKLSHKGNWVTEQEPTCTQTGSAYRDCTVCGNHETKTIPTTGHKGTWNVQTVATCTSNGLEVMYCDVCNARQTRTIYALSLIHI